MDTAEKAIKAFLPNPGFLVKKIPTWKLTVKDWSPEEFKTQTALLFDELNEQYGWLQEKFDFAEEQAFNAYKKNDKDKMRAKVSEMMVFEKKIALVEHISPMVENVQAKSKVLRKEKKCPEDLAKDVATIVFLAEYFNIPSFLRFKHQLKFRYGDKYIEKVCGKKKADVDEEVVAMTTYAPESKEVKARAKEQTEKFKVREKEEEKAKKEAEKAKKSGSKKSHHHHHHSDDSDDDDDDDDDDSESEEEKPKKKHHHHKKEEKAESEEEEEKPKKEKKEKKEASTEESDSE